jgi:predicted small metal-binding protein
LKEVTCMCGWRCRGTEDEVVAQVQRHGAEAHGTQATREEILALAVDVP